MSRNKMVYSKQQFHAWILPNQINDLKKASKILGKTQTDIVMEAIGIYMNMLRKQGVL